MRMFDLIKKQKQFYKNIKSVYSPALNDYVYFSSEGFIHLLYKSGRQPRSKQEFLLRLELLNYIPEAIKRCSKVAVLREVKVSSSSKTNLIYFYALLYNISSKRKIRIVIKKTSKGKYTYLSVMLHKRKSGIKKADFHRLH